MSSRGVLYALGLLLLNCSIALRSLSAYVFGAALDVNGSRSLSDGAPLFSSILCSPSREGPGIPVSYRQERGAEFGTQISRTWFSNLTVCSGKQTRAGSSGVCVSRDVLACGFPMAKGLGTPSARAQRWGAWRVTFLSFLPLLSHTVCEVRQHRGGHPVLPSELRFLRVSLQ